MLSDNSKISRNDAYLSIVWSNTKSWGFYYRCKCSGLMTSLPTLLSISFWAKIPRRGQPIDGIVRYGNAYFAFGDSANPTHNKTSLRFSTWQFRGLNPPYFMFRGRNTANTQITVDMGDVPEDCDLHWRHYVLTVDYSSTTWSLQLYIDGSLFSTGAVATGSTAPFNYPNSYFIVGGGDAGSGTTAGVKYVDEYGLFNIILPSNAIADIYNNGVPHDLEISGPAGDYTQTSNLLNYWRMGDGAGDTIGTKLNDEKGSNDLDVHNESETGNIIEGEPALGGSSIGIQ